MAMKRIFQLVLLFIAGVLVVMTILTAVLPQKLIWSGDGIVSAQTGSGRAMLYDAALIGTRTRMFFGLRESFFYDIQELHLGPSAYVRFNRCISKGSSSVRCIGGNGQTYILRVLKKPAYDQFRDDDGVDVGT